MEGDGGGSGEGMLTIVHALRDAEVAVTLTDNRGRRHTKQVSPKWKCAKAAQTVEDDDRYGFKKNNSAQIRDGRYTSSYQLAHCNITPTSPTVRSNEFPPQKNNFCPYQGNFIVGSCPEIEHGLRKSSTHNRNSTMWPTIKKLSDHTKNKRLLRKQSQPLRVRSQRAINRPTYSPRSQSPVRVDAACSSTDAVRYRVKSYEDVGNKRSLLNSPRSESRAARYRDNHQDTTYDYLKSSSRRIGRNHKKIEVRYFEDLNRFVKDTLKMYYGSRDAIEPCESVARRYEHHQKHCPKQPSDSAGRGYEEHEKYSSKQPSESIARRYEEHQKLCPMRQDISKSESNNAEAQTGCTRTRNTSVGVSPLNSDIKIESYRAFAQKDTILQRGFALNQPHFNPYLTETEHLKKQTNISIEDIVMDWAKEIPVSVNYSNDDKILREEILNDLIHNLRCIEVDEDFELKARHEIFACLSYLPMWCPDKDEKESFINTFAANLMNRLLKDKGNIEMQEVIANWIELINFAPSDDGQIVNFDKVKAFVNRRLLPVVNNRPANDDEFGKILRLEVLDILNELPINIKSNQNKFKVLNQLAGDLVFDLVNLPAVSRLPKNMIATKNVFKCSLYDQDNKYENSQDTTTNTNFEKVKIKNKVTDAVHLISKFEDIIEDWLNNIPVLSEVSRKKEYEKRINEFSVKLVNLQRDDSEDDELYDLIKEDIKVFLDNALDREDAVMAPQYKNNVVQKLTDTIKKVIEKHKNMSSKTEKKIFKEFEEDKHDNDEESEEDAVRGKESEQDSHLEEGSNQSFLNFANFLKKKLKDCFNQNPLINVNLENKKNRMSLEKAVKALLDLKIQDLKEDQLRYSAKKEVRKFLNFILESNGVRLDWKSKKNLLHKVINKLVDTDMKTCNILQKVESKVQHFSDTDKEKEEEDYVIGVDNRNKGYKKKKGKNDTKTENALEHRLGSDIKKFNSQSTYIDHRKERANKEQKAMQVDKEVEYTDHGTEGWAVEVKEAGTEPLMKKLREMSINTDKNENKTNKEQRAVQLDRERENLKEREGDVNLLAEKYKEELKCWFNSHPQLSDAFTKKENQKLLDDIVIALSGLKQLELNDDEYMKQFKRNIRNLLNVILEREGIDISWNEQDKLTRKVLNKLIFMDKNAKAKYQVPSCNEDVDENKPEAKELKKKSLTQNFKKAIKEWLDDIPEIPKGSKSIEFQKQIEEFAQKLIKLFTQDVKMEADIKKRIDQFLEFALYTEDADMLPKYKHIFIEDLFKRLNTVMEPNKDLSYDTDKQLTDWFGVMLQRYSGVDTTDFKNQLLKYQGSAFEKQRKVERKKSDQSLLMNLDKESKEIKIEDKRKGTRDSNIRKIMKDWQNTVPETSNASISKTRRPILTHDKENESSKYRNTLKPSFKDETLQRNVSFHDDTLSKQVSKVNIFTKNQLEIDVDKAMNSIHTSVEMGRIHYESHSDNEGILEWLEEIPGLGRKKKKKYRVQLAEVITSMQKLDTNLQGLADEIQNWYNETTDNEVDQTLFKSQFSKLMKTWVQAHDKVIKERTLKEIQSFLDNAYKRKCKLIDSNNQVNLEKKLMSKNDKGTAEIYSKYSWGRNKHAIDALESITSECPHYFINERNVRNNNGINKESHCFEDTSHKIVDADAVRKMNSGRKCWKKSQDNEDTIRLKNDLAKVCDKKHSFKLSSRKHVLHSDVTSSAKYKLKQAKYTTKSRSSLRGCKNTKLGIKHKKKNSRTQALDENLLDLGRKSKINNKYKRNLSNKQSFYENISDTDENEDFHSVNNYNEKLDKKEKLYKHENNAQEEQICSKIVGSHYNGSSDKYKLLKNSTFTNTRPWKRYIYDVSDDESENGNIYKSISKSKVYSSSNSSNEDSSNTENGKKKNLEYNYVEDEKSEVDDKKVGNCRKCLKIDIDCRCNTEKKDKDTNVKDADHNGSKNTHHNNSAISLIRKVNVDDDNYSDSDKIKLFKNFQNENPPLDDDIECKNTKGSLFKPLSLIGLAVSDTKKKRYIKNILARLQSFFDAEFAASCHNTSTMKNNKDSEEKYSLYFSWSDDSDSEKREKKKTSSLKKQYLFENNQSEKIINKKKVLGKLPLKNRFSGTDESEENETSVSMDEIDNQTESNKDIENCTLEKRKQIVMDEFEVDAKNNAPNPRKQSCLKKYVYYSTPNNCKNPKNGIKNLPPKISDFDKNNEYKVIEAEIRKTNCPVDEMPDDDDSKSSSSSTGKYNPDTDSSDDSEYSNCRNSPSKQKHYLSNNQYRKMVRRDKSSSDLSNSDHNYKIKTNRKFSSKSQSSTEEEKFDSDNEDDKKRKNTNAKNDSRTNSSSNENLSETSDNNSEEINNAKQSGGQKKVLHSTAVYNNIQTKLQRINTKCKSKVVKLSKLINHPVNMLDETIVANDRLKLRAGENPSSKRNGQPLSSKVKRVLSGQFHTANELKQDIMRTIDDRRGKSLSPIRRPSWTNAVSRHHRINEMKTDHEIKNATELSTPIKNQKTMINVSCSSIAGSFKGIEVRHNKSLSEGSRKPKIRIKKNISTEYKSNPTRPIREDIKRAITDIIRKSKNKMLIDRAAIQQAIVGVLKNRAGLTDIDSRSLTNYIIRQVEKELAYGNIFKDTSRTNIYYVEEVNDSKAEKTRNNKRTSTTSEEEEGDDSRRNSKSNDTKDKSPRNSKSDDISYASKDSSVSVFDAIDSSQEMILTKPISKDTKHSISKIIERDKDKLFTTSCEGTKADIMKILKNRANLTHYEAKALASDIVKKAKAVYSQVNNANAEVRKTLNKDINEVLDKAGIDHDRGEIEEGMTDLLTDEILHGALDDKTKGSMLNILVHSEVPEEKAKHITDELMERAMGISHQHAANSLNTGADNDFRGPAQKIITDFVKERTGDLTPTSEKTLKKDTVALVKELEELFLNSDSVPRDETSKAMQDKILEYLKRISVTADESVTDLAQKLNNQLWNEGPLQNRRKSSIKTPQDQRFATSTPHGPFKQFDPRASAISDETIKNNEQRYINELNDLIQSWMSTLPYIQNAIQNTNYKDIMAKDLAGDIIDRQKYLQLNPGQKPTDEEELEQLKFQIFRWLNKIEPVYDLTPFTPHIADLLEKIKDLPVLSLIKPTKKQDVRAYRKPTQLLYDIVTSWCEDLPIYAEDSPEDQEKVNTIKQGLASKLMNKIGELNLNPEILNDDFLYEDSLIDEIDKLADNIPSNPELEKYLPVLKRDLVTRVKQVKQKIVNELEGQAYKQQLRNTINRSIKLPQCLSPEDMASFELLKENLADAFISLHYAVDNEEEKRRAKKKIADEINRFCNEHLQRHDLPSCSIDTQKINQELYNALVKVPVPKDESMRSEIEQVRIKDVINNWIKDLPLRETTDLEMLLRNKTISLLAKRLQELEKEKQSPLDLETTVKMHEEITKWLRKNNLRPGSDIPKMAEKLIEMLRRTENCRKFDSMYSPDSCYCASKSLLHMPACSLSPQDKSHLQKIRERVSKSTKCFKDGCGLIGRTSHESQTDVRPCVVDRPVCAGITSSTTQAPCKKNIPCQMPISPQMIVQEYNWNSTDTKVQRSSQSDIANQSSQLHRPPSKEQGVQQSTQLKEAACSPHTRESCTTTRPSSTLAPPNTQTRASHTAPRPCKYVPQNDESRSSESYPEDRPCRRRDSYNVPESTSRSCRCYEELCRRESRYRDRESSPREYTRCIRKPRADEMEWSSYRRPNDASYCSMYPKSGAHIINIPDQDRGKRDKERREDKMRCRCEKMKYKGRPSRDKDGFLIPCPKCGGFDCPNPSYLFFR